MIGFHIWLGVLGTIYIADRVLNTLLRIAEYNNENNVIEEEEEIPEHARSMYS